jgi:hypothetical protein
MRLWFPGSTLIGMPTPSATMGAAHGVHAADGVGRGNAAATHRVVNDRYEEAGGGNQGLSLSFVNRCIVGGFNAYSSSAQVQPRHIAGKFSGFQPSNARLPVRSRRRATGWSYGDQQFRGCRMSSSGCFSEKIVEWSRGQGQLSAEASKFYDKALFLAVAKTRLPVRCDLSLCSSASNPARRAAAPAPLARIMLKKSNRHRFPPIFRCCR